jgi:hypothetical protein
VEVEVVVRDKNGPVAGLSREDFTLLDQGKAQKIAVFLNGSACRCGFELHEPIGPGCRRCDCSAIRSSEYEFR